MSHGAIAPSVYIGDADVGTAIAAITGNTVDMHLDGINGFTFHNVWTGTAAATLTFFGSNDPRARATAQKGTIAAVPTGSASANWVDISASLTFTNPATGGGNDLVIISNTRFAFIRMVVASPSGSGNFNSWVCSHGAG